jgi:hypothetical protein
VTLCVVGDEGARSLRPERWHVPVSPAPASASPIPTLPGTDPHIIETDLPAPEVAILRTRTGVLALVDRRVDPERRRRALAAARVLATLDEPPAPRGRAMVRRIGTLAIVVAPTVSLLAACYIPLPT